MGRPRSPVTGLSTFKEHHPSCAAVRIIEYFRKKESMNQKHLVHLVLDDLCHQMDSTNAVYEPVEDNEDEGDVGIFLDALNGEPDGL